MGDPRREHGVSVLSPPPLRTCASGLTQPCDTTTVRTHTMAVRLAHRYCFNTAVMARQGGVVLRSKSVDLPMAHVLDANGFELQVMVQDPARVAHPEYVVGKAAGGGRM